jgi:hypothetical protein
MKKIYILVIAILGLTSRVSAQCSTSSTPFQNCSYYGDRITAFSLNSIASVGNSGCATNGYSLYATPVRTLVLGNTYSWTASTGVSYANGMGIWIDWDNNNQFSSTEMVAQKNYAYTHSGTLTVPYNAVTGVNLRMRVMCSEYYNFLSNTNPCSSLNGYGETEDYDVYIACPASLPTPSVMASSTLLCLGQSATLTASGAQTYTWSGGAGVTNGVAFTPSVSATYTVVAGITGCPSSTSTAVRTISVTNVPLTISVSSSSSLICSGTTATLTATGASSFTWMPSSLTLSSAVVSPNSNTTYTVTGYNGGGCPGANTIALSVNPQPTLTTVTSSSMVCAGSSATLTASGALTYTWTSNGTGSSIVVTPTTPSIYYVSGSNASGCIGQSSALVLTNPSPTLNTIASSTYVCSGNGVVLTASGADSYAWSGGPTTSSYSVSPTALTSYTVTGTLMSTGCNSQKVITIDVYNPAITTSPSPSICVGSSASLTASGAVNYTWNPGFASQSVVVMPTTTTIYTLTSNSPTTGIASCFRTNTVAVVVNQLPIITVSASPSVVCKFQTTTITATGASNFVWNTNETTSSIVVTPSVSGVKTFSVIGTDANGCNGNASIYLNVTGCTSLKDLTIQNTIGVFPNPNKGDFTITHNQPIDLDIVNELGQLIQRVSLSEKNNNSVTLTDMASGIYFVIGKGSEGQLVQKVIVK